MLLIAHRGDTVNHKENTLGAFVSAFEKGADGIELDVHLFNDKLIVVHDFLFDRNKVYPLLPDVLGVIHSKGRIEIEIKSYDTNILGHLKPVLDKYPKADFELTTSEIPLARFIKEFFPSMSLGLILNANLFESWMTPELVAKKMIGWGKMTTANVLHIPLKTLANFGGKELAAHIKGAGFVVHSHIFKSESDKADLDMAKSWGIDQCTIDNINLITNESYGIRL